MQVKLLEVQQKDRIDSKRARELEKTLSKKQKLAREKLEFDKHQDDEWLKNEIEDKKYKDKQKEKMLVRI